MGEGSGPVVVRALGDAAGAALVWRTHGLHRVTVVVKARFALAPGGSMRLLPPEAEPFAWADEHVGDAPRSSLRRPNDLKPFVPRADVLFLGSAWAPRGSALQAAAVRIAMAGEDRPPFQKVLHVYGDRLAPAPGAPPPPPEPFTRMPLVYERTARGSGFDENPAGLVAVPGAPMPNIVDPSDPEGPAGFGPIPRAWPLRRRLLRAADPASIDGALPDIPDAFAWSYFHAAPPDQRVPFFRGDEWIALDGLHPELARIESQLPLARAEARVYGAPGRAPGTFAALELVADTLLVDGDAGTCTLTWRGNLPIEQASAIGRLRVLVGVETCDRPLRWPSALGLASPGAARGYGGISDETTRVVSLTELSAAHAESSSRRGPSPGAPLVQGPVSFAIAEEQTTVGDPSALSALAARGEGAEPTGPPTLRVFASPWGAAGGSPARSPGGSPGALDPDATLPNVGAPVFAAGPSPLATTAPTPAGHPPFEIDEPDTSVQDSGELSELLSMLSEVEAAAADEGGPASGATHASAGPEGRAALERRLAEGLPIAGMSLAGADLSGMDLSGRSLDGADLARASLRGTRLEGASLVGARLSLADLSGATLDSACLERADFYGAALGASSLRRARLSGANFSTAVGDGAAFDEATGAGALFGGGRWSFASFRGAKLSSSDFTEALLDEAVFDDAELEAARMCAARAKKASFVRVTASGLRCDGADLEGAAFVDAFAPDSVWDEACLDGVTLRGAMLPGASFVKASCRGADFSGAELAGARLERARLDNAQLVRTDVGGASFEGADLSGADLRGANVDASSMSEAVLVETKLD